ncbi:vitamin K epoxide reductase family protein [Mycolicibacterium diernhoferi]|uniref:vitamin K epoxide reductase family protein n=1 Tax=Mycolicibacterium diernhoferi TaxID=1801 RepID=UPI0009A183B6|nr:vitamin K epoxide reductase family protein [Mycolicibacterium diernhoferi]QYL24707.1 vitamin K epoxide reductase family protein [Mycolicibacterium diernhoferi]
MTVATDLDSTDTSAGRSGVRRSSAIGVLIAGVLGLAAAAALTVEKIEILIDPSYIPSCSLNPVLSCGSVMITPQASVFGFPNSLIGIVGFTVVLVTGVLAVARVSLPRWYWAGLAIGTALGTVFVHWLIFQSLYRIGALCPYCMVVWVVTIPLLVIAASIALRADTATGVAGALYQWRWSLVALWFTAVLLMILVRFWNYWSTLL